MSKPLIGVTIFRKEDAENKSFYGSIDCNYIQAIDRAGGLPLPIPILSTLEDINNYVNLLDGLVLSGGQDISPELYREKPIKELTQVDLERDKWEIGLFTAAYEANLPILGICRGMQLINVALGGSLYQDLNTQQDNNLFHTSQKSSACAYHKVYIDSSSKLSEILCSLDDLYVNSYHHQAVKEPGNNLSITSKSSEGIIESIEAKDQDFVLGVQWHPEDLVQSEVCFQELFKALVTQASTS
ncbi:MAG: gamma-glutamyl-gamma-aminobutyrate hydrolase family protein [Bacillota bacterium]